MEFDMTGIRPMLAMPTHRDIPAATVRSLLETQHALLRRGIQSDIEMQVGGSLVHHARTKAAWHFLQSKCNRLFWVDSDIVWTGDDFIRLLALSTKLECVAAAYPCRAEPMKFFLGIDGEEHIYEANEFGCISVNSLGLGFSVIQREVIEKLAERAPKLEYPDIDEGPVPRIFRCDDHDGYARGEDMAFFSDVRELGYKVWLDPHIELGHIGVKEYRASIADHLVEHTPATTPQAA
jgi:hypothetical protein